MAFPWLINGDTNHLLTGMILQVPYTRFAGLNSVVRSKIAFTILGHSLHPQKFNGWVSQSHGGLFASKMIFRILSWGWFLGSKAVNFGGSIATQCKKGNQDLGSKDIANWVPLRFLDIPNYPFIRLQLHLGVSKNRGTPKSSNLIGFSIINHPFWGYHYFRKPPFITGRGPLPSLHIEVPPFFSRSFVYVDFVASMLGVLRSEDTPLMLDACDTGRVFGEALVEGTTQITLLVDNIFPMNTLWRWFSFS